MTQGPNLEALPEDWHRALAVVAHPDDLEYGASGAIARWTSQGKEVIYLIVTKGEAGIDSMPPEETGPLRVQEEQNSARAVGVDVVEFLDHQDGVIEEGLLLRRDIALAIRRHRPDVVITMSYEDGPRGPSSADHRAVGLAVVDAARDAGNRWVFMDQLTEQNSGGLEPWNGVQMICLTNVSNPTHGVDVTGYMDKAVASLREHRVYLSNLSRQENPSDMLRSQAQERGKLLGCKYAVVFQVMTM